MNDNTISPKEFQLADRQYRMLDTESHTDPVVERLRLAIRQEQEEKGKTGNVPFPTDTQTVIKREGSPAASLDYTHPTGMGRRDK